jgi:hypothetical protein
MNLVHSTLPSKSGPQEQISASSLRARCAAFYLPQFHPIPENSAAWGPGFTEWTNVRKAKPLFPGHQQPVEPGELGYYDLREPEVRVRQAELARAHGISGFIYWHYWFNGRRLLERPFNEVLASDEPNFPFCLAWANESWTGVWHGNPGQTIVAQTYGGKPDEERHFHALLPAFQDPRYMRIDGKPIFMVYAPFSLPDAAGFIEHWNTLAEANGLPGIYFIALKSGKVADNRMAPMFDATSTLRPSLRDLPPVGRAANGARRALKAMGVDLPRTTPMRHCYRRAVLRGQDAARDANWFPCVFSTWDNTPRSGNNGHVYLNWSPELFSRQLEDAIRLVQDREFDKRLVLLRSWNEWAEGNMLEPDAVRGDIILKTIQKTVVAGE